MEEDAVFSVERIKHDGLTLSTREGRHAREHFVSWSSMNLARSPEHHKDEAVLQWKLYCVDCDHKRSWRDTDHDVCLLGRRGKVPEPKVIKLRTGFLHLRMVLNKGALLHGLCKADTVGLLQLASPLSICLRHRQGSNRGHECLCGTHVSKQVHQLSKRRRRKAVLSEAADDYAANWGSIVEIEAAASAVDSEESRLLFNVDVRWEITRKCNSEKKLLRGHFDIPFHFAKRHSLKFRGLIGSGGETASGWLCVRAESFCNGTRSWWSRHAHVIGASIPGHGTSSPYLIVDDDDLEPDVHRKNGIGGLITVTFEIIPEEGQGAAMMPPDNAQWIIEYLPKAISYQVMHIALADINQGLGPSGSAKPLLLAREVALGTFEPSVTVDTTDLSCWSLNCSQEAAVHHSLSQPLHLVHGPAGTGKTRTAAALMGTFAQQNAARRCIVLFCAPTNRAVDSALQCMSQLCEGVRLLRVYSADAERADFPLPRRGSSRPAHTARAPRVADALKRFALHFRCHAAGDGEDPSKESSATRQAYKRLCSIGAKDPDFDKLRTEYVRLYGEARALEVRQADIIFTTCVSVRRNALLEALWKEGAPQICQVILDEAAQCVEPEALCPMALARNAKHIIMFGDHCQLRPTIQSAVAAEAGMDISLFERWACWERETSPAGPLITLLQQQYRMHPSISHFPCAHFYSGLVKDAPCTKHLEHGVLTHATSGEDLQKRAAVLFWDVRAESGDESKQSVRTSASGGVGSRANQAEAKHAASLAIQIAEVSGDSAVAVLSWYSNQVALIKGILADSGRKRIHVGTISTAQGSEWDYVILSAVRTQSSEKSLGILSDAHVLTVALTRGILGLVIIGDRRALESSHHWSSLARDCDQRKLWTSKSPGVMALSKADCRIAQQSSKVRKLSLNCRKEVHGDSSYDAPTANPRKLSDADFSRLLQHSGKLASYARAESVPQRSAQSSACKEKITVAAHKGVLFGAVKKKARSWRSQIERSSSASKSPGRSASVSRSRSRRGAKR
mmetsp:Transcript_128937/g.241165  ORF Transcript_128937/g.241165 Transcript_128937/m.241165 type:complete len:1020 (+) Transcript_128937:50-3109(+)